MRIMALSLLGAAICASSVLASPVVTPVGETHRQADDPNAALRDSAHGNRLRVTIWYPAAPGAVERRIAIGPDDHPIFDVGTAAMDAPPAPDQGRRRPVILLSHGFGGSARMMGWFGIAMARQGYVVIAVDHPGNNGMDPMTVPGAILSWQRANDLKRALDAVARDGAIGPHIDVTRIGLAGFSAGGFTALIGAGARADPARFQRFCADHADDGVCRPQLEFQIAPAQLDAVLQDPAVADAVRHAGDDYHIAGVRAVFAMAPAIVQAIVPDSLARMQLPVSIVLGGADTVAPPSTNGLVAARLIPHARLHVLPGAGHYDFLSHCAPAAQIPLCSLATHQDMAHQAAIRDATRLFKERL